MGKGRGVRGVRRIQGTAEGRVWRTPEAESRMLK